MKAHPEKCPFCRAKLKGERLFCSRCGYALPTKEPEPVDKIPKDWLLERTTVEQVETAGLDDRTQTGTISITFQFTPDNEEWMRLKTAMQTGDELWKYCSSAESWKDLRGRAGIALVRDGLVIDEITEVMN